MTRPVPDRDSLPFWSALREHRLVLQRCASCGAVRWPPRALCNGCGSFEWSWAPAEGHGTIVSWTVSHRSFQPGRDAPYVVVLVRLAEADNLILPGSWTGDPAGRDLAVGQPVDVAFLDFHADDAGEAFTLLGWREKRA